MDTLIMNKQWIEASHYHANNYREKHYKEGCRALYEYLDVVGLFETGWITYNFDAYNEDERNKYGYPK